MKLTFLGANHEVTGSCTLLETGGLRILIDCGMEQGKDVYENQPLPIPVEQIDGVLLTHAHIDHSGHLPLLAKQGYAGKIYATRPTCHLCDIMLRDSAHIQESEAEWKTRKNTRAGLPPVERTIQWRTPRRPSACSKGWTTAKRSSWPRGWRPALPM